MGLTLMSDILIRNVLKKLECAEYVLQVITADRTLQVAECIVQKDYKNLQGRSAVLDCVARDTRGRVYDVEIQQESEGASPRRVRELKETQKGVDAMCREMDALYQEGIALGEERGIALGEERGIEIGEARGMEQGKREMVLSLSEMGISLEQIAHAARESVDQIRQWIAEKN